MRFEVESWRKLYRHEPLEQRAWPVTTRALRDHLLRYPEDVNGHLLDAAGTLTGQDRDTWVDMVVQLLCDALGTHQDERSAIERGLRTLIADKYLVITEDSVVVIRNFERAQRSAEARKKARQRARSTKGQVGDTTGTPPGPNGDTTGLARARSDQTRRDLDETRSDPPNPRDSDSGAPEQSEIQQRACKVLDNPHDGQYSKPSGWPEVMAVARAWSEPFGIKNIRLRDYPPGDSDLRAILEALRDGYGVDELVALGAKAAVDVYFRGLKKPGPASFTAGVIRRLLGDGALPPKGPTLVTDADVDRMLGKAAS